MIATYEQEKSSMKQIVICLLGLIFLNLSLIFIS